MKTKHIAFLVLAGFIGFSLFLSSCQKQEELLDTLDVGISQDNALAEDAFTEVQILADQAYEGGNLSFKTGSGWIAGGCATITHDTTSNPKVITIDFGPVNCLCADGKYRRGKIIITYTGPYKHPGTVINITTADYFVNDNQVIGTRTVVNQGPDAQGHPVWTITVNGSIVKANNGGTISYSAQHTRTMIHGYQTPQNWSDDVYLITGSASGKSASGVKYDVDITVPLRREVPCKWFVSGVLEITRYGAQTKVFTLNYGNGNCDNKALLTGPNGYTKVITLP